MKAVVLISGRAEWADVPIPRLASQQVLVRVRAAALNRVDLLVLGGTAHGSRGGDGTVLGVEWAGDVEAVSDDVTDWKVGDRVMGSGPAAFAELTAAPAYRLLPLPANMSYEQGAVLPVGMQTMHDALASNAQIQPGHSVFMQGASSGMGLLGMQIAKLLGASQVIGSTRNAQSAARLAAYGADAVVNTSTPDWVQAVLERTGQRGVDAAVDMVAGPLVNALMECIQPGGALVNVGRVGGEQGRFDFDLHSQRRIRYFGVSFRSRTPEQVANVVSKARADLYAPMRAGRLQVPIDSTFRMADAGEALARMALNRHFGKIVLTSA